MRQRHPKVRSSSPTRLAAARRSPAIPNPAHSSAIQLQSTAGNRAIASLLGLEDLSPEPADERGYVVPALGPPQRAGGKHLPAQLRTEFEGSFDADFRNIKVHENEAMADEVGATAFTVGNDIHFAPGRFQPHSGSGRRVIAHELTHVLQQRSGRVRAPEGEGLPVNTEAQLETEADRVGRHAAWRMPVKVRGARQATRRPVDITAQAGSAHAPLRSASDAE